MALKIAGQAQLAPTTATTIDFRPLIHGTTAPVFDADVKGALFFASNAVNNSTIYAHAKCMLGMTDGTNHACVTTSGADAVATSIWNTRLDNDRAACFISPSSQTVVSQATASLLTDGVRLSFSAADATTQNRIDGIVIGGSGIEVQVVTGSWTGGAPETKTVSHTLSGAPDLVIGMMSGHIMNTVAGQGRSSFGFYSRAANTYVGMAQTRLNGQVAEDAGQLISTSWIIAEVSNSALNYAVTLGNFTASSFDASTSANAGTDGFAFMLIKGANLEVKTGTFTTPTDANEFNIVTGLTTKPKAMLVLSTIMTLFNTHRHDDGADWYGFGAALENNGVTEHLCAGAQTVDASSPTRNKSLSAALLTHIPTLTGTPVSLLVGTATLKNNSITASYGTFDTVARYQGYVTLGDVNVAVNLGSVTTDPFVDGTATILTSVGSSFAASGNTVSWNGSAFTVTAENVDTITATAAIGTNVYGETLPLTVTSSAVQSNPLQLYMVPPSGQRYFDLSGGLNSNTAIRLESSPNLVNNAQIHVSALRDSGGISKSLQLLTIAPDGTPLLDRSVSVPAQFDARANNRDGEGWGAVQTITLNIGYLTVPDKSGSDEITAVADLQSIGFAVGVQRISNQLPVGTVISQNLAIGTHVPIGTAITLSVSLGTGTAPTGLAGVAQSASSVRLSWNAMT